MKTTIHHDKPILEQCTIWVHRETGEYMVLDIRRTHVKLAGTLTTTKYLQCATINERPPYGYRKYFVPLQVNVVRTVALPDDTKIVPNLASSEWVLQHREEL